MWCSSSALPRPAENPAVLARETASVSRVVLPMPGSPWSRARAPLPVRATEVISAWSSSSSASRPRRPLRVSGSPDPATSAPSCPCSPAEAGFGACRSVTPCPGAACRCRKVPSPGGSASASDSGSTVSVRPPSVGKRTGAGAKSRGARFPVGTPCGSAPPQVKPLPSPSASAQWAVARTASSINRTTGCGWASITRCEESTSTVVIPARR